MPLCKRLDELAGILPIVDRDDQFRCKEGNLMNRRDTRKVISLDVTNCALMTNGDVLIWRRRRLSLLLIILSTVIKEYLHRSSM